MAGAGKQLGNVSFSTDFAVDTAHRKNCTYDASRTCAKASLNVTCNHATDLVDLDGYTQGVTDPYCKVRVKKDERHPSSKDATPAMDDNLNPTWNEANTFSYVWEVELAPPQVEETDEDETNDGFFAWLWGSKETKEADVPEPVTWTLDQMTVMEQFISNTRFLIKETALGGKECSEIAEKSATQQEVCELLAILDEFKVTDKVVNQIKEKMPDSDIAGVLDGVPVTNEAGDSLLQKEGEDSSSSPPRRVVHHHHYRRNRPHRPRRAVHHHHYSPRPVRQYHYGYYSGNRRRVVVHQQCRGPHCKWVALTFILFFILLIPIGL